MFRVGVPNLEICEIKMIIVVGAMADAKRKLKMFKIVNKKQKLEAEKLIKENKVIAKIVNDVNPVYAKNENNN